MKKTAQFDELSWEELTWSLDPGKIDFETSDGCEPCEEIIGQNRALKALQTGLDIRSLGYNIFITGLAGTGRITTVKKLLEELKKEQRTPDDILYVNNFRNPDEPTLIVLPAKQGREFRADMEHLIEMLKNNVPELLKSEYYTKKRDEIVEELRKKQKDILQTFENEVAKEGFTVIQVQMGLFTKPDLVPLIEGKPVSFSELDSRARKGDFPKEKLDDLKEKYARLTGKLEEIFKALKEIEEGIREKLKKWDEESITPIIRGAIDEMKAKYDQDKISSYLTAVERDLVKRIELFKNQKIEQKQEHAADPFLPYKVNLLIDNSEAEGAPVIIENNPNYINLFGSIEASPTRFGFIQTDFSKIKAGSFLKANGGYLIINALDALSEPGVWITLKRTLRYQTLEIQNYASLYLFSTSRIKPEKIKCDVNVVMIGESYIYSLLYFMDPDFKKIFKVKAEFDSETDKNKDVIDKYIGFIKKITDEDRLLPFDREAMSRIIEYATRLAGRQRKVSTRFHILADVIRESSYLAQKENKNTVVRDHVDSAIEDRFERVSLIEDKIQEMIEEGTIMIDTEGGVVGQVNGLSVYVMGEFMFGKPTRITARTAVGRGGVINIEREADLSGRTHNKGVLILSGYLRGKYCQKKPFALSASLAFEQSYSGVEGDSASSTEVYAILSSLSQQALRQDIAVTGSVNQRGEIQAIGAVNEKIEGFYEVCKAKGLTGKQGVIIPHQNAQNLMLNPKVVEAVKKGDFHIYTVKTIDQGIEILTGLKAGEPGEDGTFEEGTLNYLVDQELQRLAESWRSFMAREKE
jgi:lon-related putative ATP-dependent protease